MEQSPIPELINNRYEVKETIGRGGMATVYLASDRRLGRDVAIKVLKPELARDDSFQERFQREAQAVAGLNHHTITSVYDTGEIPPSVPSDVACPYIVMEYVPGQTLRQLVREDRLSTEGSVHAMEGILDALAYSHRSGIVHRDIKPANVIITPDNRVKVMDFGIARAVEDTQAALTQTQAVLGTAQYLSPEQARGENVDARSDLYSAGCVFFEMLTGRAPFVGEASVDIAAQHVRDAPPQASSLAPHLHPSFDAFMDQALAKPREARFQTAEDMRRAVVDLRDAAQVDATTVTRPVRDASGLGAAGAAGLGAAAGGTASEAAADSSDSRPEADQDGSRTAVTGAAAGAALGGTAGGAAASGQAAEAGDSQSAPVFTITPSSDGPGSGSGPGSDLDPDAPRGSRAADDDERRSPLLWLIPLLVLLAAAAVAAFLWFNRGPESVDVPEVVGMEADDAQDQLEDAGLVVDLEEELSPDGPRDHVVSVDPGEGSEVDEGSNVTLTVSQGSEAVTVPGDLEGQSESYAREMISAAGLEPAEDTQTRNSPDVPEDMVVATDPEGGSEVARDSTVGLILSTGRVTVPDVVGMTQSEAADRLGADDVQLETAVGQVQTSDYPAGTVVRQSVDGGDDVSQGSTVTITVAVEPVRTPTTSPDDSDSDSGTGGETGGGAGTGGETGGGTDTGGGDPGTTPEPPQDPTEDPPEDTEQPEEPEEPSEDEPSQEEPEGPGDDPTDPPADDPSGSGADSGSDSGSESGGSDGSDSAGSDAGGSEPQEAEPSAAATATGPAGQAPATSSAAPVAETETQTGSASEQQRATALPSPGETASSGATGGAQS